MDDWRLFQDEVRRLLDIQGWRTEREHIVAHKKIDLYAERESDFGRLRRIAVECKRFASALTQSEVAHIYADYLPLLQERHIDDIVIVTLNPISPAAVTYARTAQGLIHNTCADLQNSMMDFTSYLRSLVDDYSKDDLSRYYVAQSCKSDSGVTLVEDTILTWVQSDERDPIAILAGYGMGKTTLARKLSCTLADDHRSNPRNRIPILIPLHELVHEQSLEGLVGKVFTSRSVVRNYNFALFSELNRLGRFVIILDGFDEMKQSMSWESMRFNFTQLNRLVVPAAKVILSGRPSAFLSESEHLEALHGRRRILEHWKQIPDWPDYKELHLLPFSRPQIDEFVARYGIVRPDAASIAHQLSALLDGGDSAVGNETELGRLATRPVQLRMMLDVLPQWGGEPADLTSGLLYSEFIDLIIRREMEKLPRQRFALDIRRDFARRLAWWMWSEKMGSGVLASKIPDALFAKYTTVDISLDEARRDLLVACFVEVKQPDGYYFAHRSFQEFLVAEHILALIDGGELPLSEKVLITPEIKGFFVNSIGPSQVKKFEGLLGNHRGRVPDWLLRLLIAAVPGPGDLVEEAEGAGNPWCALAATLGLVERHWGVTPGEELAISMRIAGLHRPVSVTSENWAKLLVVMIVMLHGTLRGHGASMTTRLVELIDRAGTGAIFSGKRKVLGASLLSAHAETGLCWLDWSTEPDWLSDLGTYNLGRAKDKIAREGKGRGRPKAPHRALGPTKKKNW